MPHPIRLGQQPSTVRQKLHTDRRKLMGLSVPSFGYDGINSDALQIFKNTTNPGWVAGYVDGFYTWTQAEWDLFGPGTERVTIAVTASFDGGDVLDVENGDATPGQTEGWITMRKAAGLYRPTIYCSASVVPSVRIGTGKWILNQDYDLWVADWVGHAFQYRCADGKLAAATQYASGSWADFDVAYDPDWPHRKAPAPAPPPPPPPAPTPSPVFPVPGGRKAGPSSIVLSWNAVADAPSYHVQVEGIGGKVLYDFVDVVGTSVTVGNMTPGAEYQWRVSVSGPNGPWSALEQFHV